MAESALLSPKVHNFAKTLFEVPLKKRPVGNNPRVPCLCACLSVSEYSKITLTLRLSPHVNTFLLNVLRLSLCAYEYNKRTAVDGFS